jgi:diguanylate cyclase (GGDEF)-like protein
MESSDHEHVEIANWISQDPVTAQETESLGDVVNLMSKNKVSAVPIMNGSSLIGVFTERDLVSSYASNKENISDKPIKTLMTTDLITAQVNDDYNIVYSLMKANNIRHIPILENDKLIGIVSMRDLIHFYQNKLETDYVEARSMIDELKRLIQLSADEVLENLFAEISLYKELSLTDHLTGLYNKRYFTMRIQEETARAKRYKQELSLIFCDIDHFKRVNDEYGHHCGDVVLRKAGQTLAGGMGELKVVTRLRKSDIIARYGGEEFVVILPETTAENAGIAAEKMRSVIENTVMEIEGQSIKITMSFGVAGMCDKVNTSDDLIKKADNAMYEAKQRGRNRVEIDQDN